MPTTLSREQARRVYDRLGAFLESQAFYEDPATAELVRHARLDTAQRVVELGCGTGRLALDVLSRQLPSTAQYRGYDLSPVMVALARERLLHFGPRAQVTLTDGSLPLPEADASCDRFVSTYVLDLLAEDDIVAVVGEARRVLVPCGLLCLAGLSTGTGALARLVSRIWASLHALGPAIVGGCRPIELRDWVSTEHWRVLHQAKVEPFGVCSEVVVAERR